MEKGKIDLAEVKGPFDLQSTIESGQTYLWKREDDQMFEEDELYGGSAWYYTVLPSSYTGADPEVVKVRQKDEKLEWHSSFDAAPVVKELLRLEDDLEHIESRLPEHDVLNQALERYRGMRVVNDPGFPCLVSFICSAQMRVERIQQMQENMARRFGEPVEFDGLTYHAFPTPEQLAQTSEQELRDCSLGYRAPYVKSTAEMVHEDETRPEEARSLDYEDAREHMKQFVGVGDKVADCALLFSQGFLQAIPLDTWLRTTIEEHFPECDRGNYAETSAALRQKLGGEHAGYAQTYVFFHLRTR